MKKLLLAALAALGIFSANPANAAQDQVLAFVVATCGTLATPYVAGKYGILTMDVNGKLCDSSTGGGGGGGTSATFGAAFPTTGTPAGGTDGTNFQPLVVDTTTHYLQVDVKTQTPPSSLPLPTGAAQQTGATVGLVAGTALVGKFGIDQTTPGTTNQVTAAAPTVALTALVKGTTAAMIGTTSTQVIAAVTSQHIYVTAIHCTNSSATVPTLVSVQDGSGGVVLDTLSCNDNFGGDERNGGGVPLFWTTAGNALFVVDVTTGASVIVQASGYSSAN